jgi:hypothetical protein
MPIFRQYLPALQLDEALQNKFEDAFEDAETLSGTKFPEVR